jgi:hypothetical protein
VLKYDLLPSDSTRRRADFSKVRPPIHFSPLIASPSPAFPCEISLDKHKQPPYTLTTKKEVLIDSIYAWRRQPVFARPKTRKEQVYVFNSSVDKRILRCMPVGVLCVRGERARLFASVAALGYSLSGIHGVRVGAGLVLSRNDCRTNEAEWQHRSWRF